MNNWKLSLSALMVSVMVIACGGGNDAPAPAPAPSFTSLVSFGDSLSDVGTHKVGAIAAAGGGKYTVNSASALNWTEIVAQNFKLPAPCAAQTGLDGTAQGFMVPVVNHPDCFAYGQGGSRVTNPVGPENKLLGGIGQLTVPVAVQMQNHLNKVGGTYAGKELVTVLAGGNDLFIQARAASAATDGGTTAVALGVVAGWTTGTGSLAATLAAGGGTATQVAAEQAVIAMAQAGADLAIYVKTLIVDKGAKSVVVINLPNVSKTPFALAESVQTQGFIDTMTSAFNKYLKDGLTGVAGVVFADGYAQSTAQANSPATFGLTNVTAPACGATSSLVCTPTNVTATDGSTYLYADGVHLTPLGYDLVAKFVIAEMLKAGLK
jgi:outer membrane lipase/esterase